MRYYDTEDAQNLISRIKNGIGLNVKNPDEKMKRQYFKALQALQKVEHELDLINDLKDKLAHKEG